MSRMRTSWIIVANIAVMAAILVFVALYSNHEKKEHYQNQVEHFVNTTIAMERVTGNYMVGEQGICDNWAKYINSRDLTLEEATDYVRATHVSESTSAHLIDAESLKGYSTRPRPNTEDGYEVSYERMDLFGDGAWIADQHHPDLYQPRQRGAVAGLLQPDHSAGRRERGEEAGLSAAHRAGIQSGRKMGLPAGRVRARRVLHHRQREQLCHQGAFVQKRQLLRVL